MSDAGLIAVVDDDDSAREAIAGLVKTFGFAVVAFASGAALLQSQDLSRVACLIADMRMPEMTGLELVQRLKRARTPVPTVLVSAYPNEQTRRQVLAAGAVGYLAKPIDGDLLLACLRDALRPPT